mmetsp:Transcript_49753/g.50578  ORF Transcript_49753/g.50578 Transcript_49753/m.50578 type:complete len:518 (-) Transcript_49753:7-1560(-)
MTTSGGSKVIRTLYRNLLRTSKPFTSPAPNAAVLCCLLHRTGIDDHIKDWNTFVARNLENGVDRTTDDKAKDLTYSYSDILLQQKLEQGEFTSTIPLDGISASTAPTIHSNRTYQRLFRRLLREAVTGTNNHGKMVFPSQVDTTKLEKIIQREFRNESGNASISFDDATRRQVAFTALRELNKKLSYYETLRESNPKQIPQQAAWHVSSLPFHPPASYLRPGVFLVSHPYMHDSYFSRTVICILEHKGLGDILRNGRTKKKCNDDEDEYVDDDLDGEGKDEENNPIAKRIIRQVAPPGQTYGLIVNRVSIHNEAGQNRTLKEVFREHMLPEKLSNIFGDSVVREGGPVNVALQMIHSLSSPSEQEDVASAVGGTIIPTIINEEESPALYSDRATYFQGNMFKILSEVKEGTIDRDDISFFIGATTWSPGQLASEIAQGYWIPCIGPPEMALDGICEHEPTSSGKRPLADLWLSMMSACGEDEAKLSHLFHREHWGENGLPCDAFDDDDNDDDGDFLF